MAALGFVALMTLDGLVLMACHPLTEIVLIVDTDMTAPVDLDSVRLDIKGPTEPVEVKTVSNIGAAGGPTFPLTLGLTAAGALSPVEVTVTASQLGRPVTEQQIRTAFVHGERRLLRMLMLSSCLGITCADGETCGGNGCGPIDRPGPSLPTWNGIVPVPPSSQPTLPILGRTLWVAPYHSCANEGTVLYCWGRNYDGQLGSNTTINGSMRKPVVNLQEPTAVGLGTFISCVCDRSAQALCSGSNLKGVLGNGTVTPSMVPTAVTGVNDCAQIAGGAEHACVVHQGGTVSCWGGNSFGQVGVGVAPATAQLTVPTAVRGLTDVIEVGAGERHTCARRTDGTVWCWGDNSGRALGDGTTTSHSAPAPVIGLTDVVELAVGRFATCARLSTGHVMCWGSNSGGMLGDGTRVDSAKPVEAGGVTDAIQVSVGQQHTCVLRAGGVMSCWGMNAYGQLGTGNAIDSLVPVDVVGLSGVTSIGAGSRHSCARHNAGVSCWGDNFVAQLGDNSEAPSLLPVFVSGFP
jgi:alpha-tubulin suppressor-like RCC1 family protein